MMRSRRRLQNCAVSLSSLSLVDSLFSLSLSLSLDTKIDRCKEHRCMLVFSRFFSLFFLSLFHVIVDLFALGAEEREEEEENAC